MKTNSLLLFLLIFLAFSACRKPVNGFENPDFDAEPTLNAILTEGEPVWAQVTLARALDSVHTLPCRNATVQLYVDGTFAEQLNYDAESDCYRGNTLALSHHDYTCKVLVPGYDTISATTEIPEKATVRGIRIIDNAIINDEGVPCPAILLTFTNNPDEPCYYTVNMSLYEKKEYDDGNSTAIGGTITESYNTDDPVLLNEGSGSLLFSNEIIDDTTYTLKVNCGFSSYNSAQAGHPQGSFTSSGHVVVRMHSLSESCYHYLKSQNAYVALDAYTNPFIGVITPINFYSNVENGLGIFGAITPLTCDTLFFTND